MILRKAEMEATKVLISYFCFTCL